MSKKRVSEQNTLNQIIEKREKQTRTGYPDHMTKEDYIYCFKKWLKHKQNKFPDFKTPVYSAFNDGYKLAIKELLEDLEK